MSYARTEKSTLPKVQEANIGFNKYFHLALLGLFFMQILIKLQKYIYSADSI